MDKYFFNFFKFFLSALSGVPALRLFLFITPLFVFSSLGFGQGKQSQLQISEDFNNKFKELIIDVRGSHGGNGDVTAGYLTIMDFIKKYGINSAITVLADSQSKTILEAIAKGNSEFWSRVTLASLNTLPENKVFDFYLTLASPSGSFRYAKDFNEEVAPDPLQSEKPKSEIEILLEDPEINTLLAELDRIKNQIHANEKKFTLFTNKVEDFIVIEVAIKKLHELFEERRQKLLILAYDKGIDPLIIDEFLVKTEKKAKINLKANAVLIVQTVLGNTENHNLNGNTYLSTNHNAGTATTNNKSERAFNSNFLATVRTQGVNYSMSPAGIAPSESGFYNDYVATELRDKNISEIEQFILSELSSIKDFKLRKSLQEIIEQTKMKEAIFGLVYGVSHPNTQKQFENYLEGLASTKSFFIVTPSDFKAEFLSDSRLRERIHIISGQDPIPEKAEPGQIYILKTATLPHKVFIGLMAYSMKKGLVPVGSGDSFMSAAINLGGPFVLTRVEWNAKNIGHLKSRLFELININFNYNYNSIQKGPYPYDDNSKENFKDSNSFSSKSKQKELINAIFGESLNLKEAQQLKSPHIKPLFQALDQQIPHLSERLINAAIMIRDLSEESSMENFRNHSEKILDNTLKRSVQQSRPRTLQNYLEEGKRATSKINNYIHSLFNFTTANNKTNPSNKIKQDVQLAPQAPQAPQALQSSQATQSPQAPLGVGSRRKFCSRILLFDTN